MHQLKNGFRENGFDCGCGQRVSIQLHFFQELRVDQLPDGEILELVVRQVELLQQQRKNAVLELDVVARQQQDLQRRQLRESLEFQVAELIIGQINFLELHLERVVECVDGLDNHLLERVLADCGDLVAAQNHSPEVDGAVEEKILQF